MADYLAGDILPADDLDWHDWTTTLSNITKGAGGTLTTKYRRMGPTVDFVFFFRFGSGSAVGTNPGFTLPAALSSVYPTSSFFILPFTLVLNDSGTTQTRGGVYAATSTTALTLVYWNGNTPTTISSTAPWTWATGDYMLASGTYLAA